MKIDKAKIDQRGWCIEWERVGVERWPASKPHKPGPNGVGLLSVQRPNHWAIILFGVVVRESYGRSSGPTIMKYHLL